MDERIKEMMKKLTNNGDSFEIGYKAGFTAALSMYDKEKSQVLREYISDYANLKNHYTELMSLAEELFCNLEDNNTPGLVFACVRLVRDFGFNSFDLDGDIYEAVQENLEINDENYN